jgi:CRISPR-associated protein Cmr6
MPDLDHWIADNKRLGTFGFGQSVSHPFASVLDAGLWHEKFGTPRGKKIVRAGMDPRYELGVRTPEWVTKLDRQCVGHPTSLAAYANRLLDLARARGGLVFDAHIADLSKFVTGIGIANPIKNGFAWHRTLSTPYLPGSGVKGLTLAYARDWEEGIGTADLRRIFGTAIDDESKGQEKDEEKDTFTGAVVFLDAIPVAPPLLTAQILTPHGPGSGAPVDAGEGSDPEPHGFLAVKSGRFRFTLLPARGPACCRLQQCRLARHWLKLALEQTGAGAKTKSGYGRFDNFVDILDQTPETLSATTL